MTGLTKGVGHYHRAWSIDSTDTEDPGIECRCINSPERMTWTDYAAHVAEVTEAAVRAAVAEEVRAEVDGWDRCGTYAARKHTMFNRLADRIAEGQ